MPSLEVNNIAYRGANKGGVSIRREQIMSENGNYPQQGGAGPGKGAAIASLTCGIISVIFVIIGLFTGVFGSFVCIITGIVGLVLAANAKKAGFEGGLRTAGFVLSIIGLALGAIIFVACVACAYACSACGSGSLDLIETAALSSL